MTEADAEPPSPASDRDGRGGLPHAILESLRPHQWLKNALLFAPIALAHELGDTDRLLAVVTGFVAFCAVASAGYLVNDILDLEADRLHPEKRARPLASGRLPRSSAIASAILLSVLGFAIAAWMLSGAFVGMLGIYFALSLLYSVHLKRRLFLDVLVLAGLYTHRVLSGGVAAGVETSTWLLAFSVFFFLSLALLKRYVELTSQPPPTAGETLAARAYLAEDRSLVETMGIASGYLSVLVLGLYVSRADVQRFYATPDFLWLVSPLMLYWISRIWLLARRGEVTHDPVLFAATDRTSYVVAASVVAIGVLATRVGA